MVFTLGMRCLINAESRKNLEQNIISQLGTLYPHEIGERLSFH